MRTSVFSPRLGGKLVPLKIRPRIEQRIQDYAAAHYPGKFLAVRVRFRGALCYVDIYLDPGDLTGLEPPWGETREQWIERLHDTPTPLFRIRYYGDEERWSFDCYLSARETYEPGFLLSGENLGTPEEAFETSAATYL